MALGRERKKPEASGPVNVQTIFERLRGSENEVVQALLFVGLIVEARGFAIERAIRGEERKPGEPD